MIEYAMLVGLLGLVTIAHAVSIADQIMDIWTDFFEKLDAIDDAVSIHPDISKSISDNGNPEATAMNPVGCRDEYAAKIPDIPLTDLDGALN